MLESLDLYGLLDKDAGWFNSIETLPIAVADSAQLLPPEAWDSKRLADGDVSSVSDPDTMASIVFDKIEGRHFQLCAPSAVSQPDLEVIVDGVSYWIPSSNDYYRVYVGEQSYHCFSSLSKIEYGVHNMIISQKSAGSISIESILLERPMTAWTSELAFGSFFYIFALLITWIFLFLFVSGVAGGIFFLIRLFLQLAGVLERPKRMPWAKKFGQPIEPDTEADGSISLQDHTFPPPAIASSIPSSKAAMAGFGNGVEEEEVTLLPEYRQ